MRYFITFSYHGKDFHGWQIQPNAITVQEVLEEKMSLLLDEKIALFGAGRTDTGVHAKKMIAHFDATIQDVSHFIFRLNSFLPDTIAVKKIDKVKYDAHARFDALYRTYHYYIHFQKNPFITEKSWYWYHPPLDITKMNEAAQYLLQVKEFTSFARLHADNKTDFCSVTEAIWNVEDNRIRFTITADRFLRNMVRAIVGTLTEVGRGKIDYNTFIEIVHQKDRKFAAASAPAHGLFLADIQYPDEIYL